MADPTYRAAAADMLRRVELDLLTAIYHRASGITHLLAAPAPELIELLQQEPATAGQALARLAARYDVADADEAAMTARLDELVESGLVRIA